MAKYDHDSWGGFVLVLWVTCFLIICNYGTILNIIIWILYIVDKSRESDWDRFHFGLTGLFVVINVLLTCIFVKYW